SKKLMCDLRNGFMNQIYSFDGIINGFAYLYSITLMMFGLFKKSALPDRPLDAEMGKIIENNIQWLAGVFPDPQVHERKIFLPTEADFPIAWSGMKENARQVLSIVAEAMQLEQHLVVLEFYNNGTRELDMGSSVIFLEDEI